MLTLAQHSTGIEKGKSDRDWGVPRCSKPVYNVNQHARKLTKPSNAWPYVLVFPELLVSFLGAWDGLRGYRRLCTVNSYTTNPRNRDSYGEEPFELAVSRGPQPHGDKDCLAPVEHNGRLIWRSDASGLR